MLAGSRQTSAAFRHLPLTLAHRILIAILTLGACAQVVQAVLIREGLVVFQGNELSLGAFYAAWLLWLAIGSMLVIAGRDRPWVREPMPALRLALLLLPILLLAQVMALRSVRLLLDVSPSELVPLGALFVSLLVIAIPSALALGISFPLACRALAAQSPARAAAGTVSRLYVADALGALIGGVVFTFVLVQWLGMARIIALLALVLGICAWSIGPWRRSGGWKALAFAALGLGIIVYPGTERLERWLESARFAGLQPGLALVDSVETRYGHVAVARLGGQTSIVADGQVRESFPEPMEIRREAAYFAAQSPGARRVLILGGLAGGLPAELLRYPAMEIDIIEADRRAFDAVRPVLPPETSRALSDPRLALHFEDARGWVNRLAADTRYDLVLTLAASPATAQGNRLFTREFYSRIRSHLSPDGVFCTRVGSAANYLGGELAGYAGSVYHTLGAVLPHLAIVPGEQQTICASATPGRVSEDPETLRERYLSMDLEAHDLPQGAFANLIDPREVAFVRDRLDSVPTEINTDERPVTYYLNMLLSGRFSGSALVDWLARARAMGPWPYVLPPVLLVVLWLIRRRMEGIPAETAARQGATFVLALLGMIAMAAQLTLLLGYQSHVGFMFERIALLNGVFMTGLALGAGAGTVLARTRYPVAALVSVMSLVAAMLLVLPIGLDTLGAKTGPLQEPGYLLLALGMGLLTGSGFPLGVVIAHSDRPEIVRSGGIAAAADNLGGALGGLVTGSLMLPLLGTGATCRVLATLAIVAIIPLVAAPLLSRWPTVAGRDRPSLPWPGLGWALLYLVLLVYGWQLIQRGTETGPQIRFDARTLQETAPGLHFRSQDQPFVHYLGSPAGSGDTTAAVLASMAAAPEVRGYAGPINLLLGVDRRGRLMDCRYLESHETPAYIAGIRDWLATLAGWDLAAGPLELMRVDALSGATVTSRAALESINRAAARVSEVAFGVSTPVLPKPAGTPIGAPFWATLVLLVAAVLIHLSGDQRARLLLLVASIVILGLWLNTPITEVDLVNLSLGNAASPAENPQRWLLLAFAGASALLFGPIWCGMLCPFGALQELISRAGRRLGLRIYADRRLDEVARFVKFILLALMLIAVWVSGETAWAVIDPMQQIFGGRLGGWMLVLAAAVLLGSLVYVRFWCRYFCPIGAFLALGNKLALLGGLAPKRRLEHCDLGVHHENHLDCIRCGRCLSGEDTRITHRHRDGVI